MPGLRPSDSQEPTHGCGSVPIKHFFNIIKIYSKTNLNKLPKPGYVPPLTVPIVVNMVDDWRAPKRLVVQTRKK
jgi:hypothetical protein